MPYGFMLPGEPRFGELGDEYEAFRTGYGAAVWEHLARHCGLGSGTRAVDLGCGTGLAMVPMLDYGADVVGIDPDAGMRSRAERHLEGRATVLDGRAESIPLGDAVVDLVVAAQSAHWFEEPAASSEIRRVLRPGGAVAYIWKYPAPDTPFVYLVDELLCKLTGQAVRTSYAVGTVAELVGDGWTEYRRAVFEQPVAYTVKSYLGYQSSRDRIQRLAGTHRDELLALLEERLLREVPSGAFVERNLAYVVTARRAT